MKKSIKLDKEKAIDLYNKSNDNAFKEMLEESFGKNFWKPEDIEKMTYHMKQASCRDLLITEKDSVKLVRYKKHFFEMKIQLWVCRMSVSFRSNEERLKSHILQIVGGSR